MKAALYLFRLNVPRPTGVQRYALELASALVAIRPDDTIEFWTGRGASNSEEARRLGLTVRTPALSRRLLHLTWTELGFPPFESVAARDADVVHLLAPSVGLPTRRPHVVTIHDLLPWQHPEWFPPGPVRRFRRTVEMAVHAGAEVICSSTYIAELLHTELGLARERIHMVFDGVRADMGAAPAEVAEGVLETLGLRSGRYVLAVGHLTQRKNLSVVARAVPKLAPDVPFVVVGGDGPGGPEVRAEVVAAAGSRAQLVGHLPDEDVRALFEHAGAFVFPSVSEGFGLPLVEAMSFGAPVIAADATCLPEIVGDAGLLVDPEDVDAWAETIARVLDDEGLADTLRKRGHARAAEFTWERAAEQTWEVYRKACAGRA